MAGKITAAFVIFVTIAFVANFGHVTCNPAIATVNDPMQVCIENCAQCKEMLGDWFNGPFCADACIRLRGKLIPECENISSIKPFLNINQL